MRARACLRLGARGLSKGHCVRALATLSPRTHTAYRRRSSRSREDLREERCEERRSSRSRLECRGSWWSPLLAVFAELSAATGAASGTSRCPTHGGQPPLAHRHGASRNLSTPTIACYHAPGASDMVTQQSVANCGDFGYYRTTARKTKSAATTNLSYFLQCTSLARPRSAECEAGAGGNVVAISVLGLCDGELMGDDRPSNHKVNAMEGTSFAKCADDQVTMASATRRSVYCGKGGSRGLGSTVPASPVVSC